MVEVIVRQVGAIAYNIPSDAKAEISSPGFRKILYGMGKLENVPAGRYKINMIGKIYKPYFEEIIVERGIIFNFLPYLEYTEKYVAQWEKEARKAEYALFTKRIESLGKRLDSERRVFKGDVDVASKLTHDVESSKYRFPDLIAKSSYLLEQAERLKEEGELKAEIDHFSNRKAELEKRLSLDIVCRKKLNTLGWISFSMGIVSSAALVPAILLGNRAYDSYEAAQLTADAVRFREEASLYNALSVGSGITGGVTLLLSPVLWRLGPKPEKLREEIGIIEARIEKLEGELR